MLANLLPDRANYILSRTEVYLLYRLQSQLGVVVSVIVARRSGGRYIHARDARHNHGSIYLSLDTGPPPSGQLNAGVRRREGLARRPYRARTRAEILARVSIRLVVN